MSRKLASIQKIVGLSAIEGADKIEKCTVLGWDLVVKKGEFKVGDGVVFCEIDSVLPPKPEFEFLRDRKFRIKTIKLKGQVSQGICFPLSILPKGKYQEGDDVTEILGVKKYDPQAVLEAKEQALLESRNSKRIDKYFLRYKWYRHLIFRPKKKSWPPFIKKTDEDRIQLFPRICESYKNIWLSVTEKLDGQSGTFFCIRNKHKWMFWKPFLFGVCSRNFELPRPDNSSYWDVARKYQIQKWLTQYLKENKSIKHIVIQGEIIGPKIQGNKYGLSENKLYVFNVVVNGVWYDCHILYNPKFSNIPMVPSLFPILMLESISDMVEYSKGKSVLAPINREGVVCRNYALGLSFKVINPDFLLEHSNE